MEKVDKVEEHHPSEMLPLSLYLLEHQEIRATLSSRTQTKALLHSLPSSLLCSRWPKRWAMKIRRWMPSPTKVAFSAQKLPIYAVGLGSTLRTWGGRQWACSRLKPTSWKHNLISYQRTKKGKYVSLIVIPAPTKNQASTKWVISTPIIAELPEVAMSTPWVTSIVTSVKTKVCLTQSNFSLTKEMVKKNCDKLKNR